jgi:hypothetical protein
MKGPDMDTAALRRFGRTFAKVARRVLFTLASRPRHAYWPLLEAKKRK